MLSAVSVLSGILLSREGLSAPHTAFVFVLLGAHVAHALLGAAFSVWMLDAKRGSVVSQTAWDLTRLVTHFLTALFLGIVVVLYGLQ